MRRALRLTIPACLVALAVAACSPNSADWFDPNWSRIVEERGAKGEVPAEEIPQAEVVDPPALPDFSIDGPIELSVEQTVLLAIQRNRDLRVAELAPVVTGAFERIERGVFDPEVFASGDFSRVESLETARSTGEQFSVEADDSLLEAGVRQTLPTGTDVEFDVTQTRSISNRAPEQQTARVGLSVTQSLLRGFGPAVNLVSVRQAELETGASRFELRGFVESLLADAEIAYWEYVLAEREIAIFERSLEIAREQSDQVAQRIEVGVLPQTEAAAARSEVALREQALIDARSERDAARLRLLRLVNAPIAAAFDREIVLTSDPEIAAQELEDLEGRVALALLSRPDLNEARLRLDQNRLETIRTRNGLLPRLDIFVAFGKTGFADTFLDSFSELDGPTFDFSIGFGFSQFIGRDAAKGAYEASIASREQAAAAVRNLEQLVELDVYLAANDVDRAREQIGATRTTRELQEETVQAENERFEVGASTTLLVAQAQRDLLQAQINEVAAVANYRIALIRLYLAEGSLLERRGVTVEALAVR